MRPSRMAIPNRYFGSPEQQGLERRAHLLWQILQDDPDYCFHGRAVGLLRTGTQDTSLQIALARLQGLGPGTRLTPEVASSRRAAIEDAGLGLEIQQRWGADESALAGARSFLCDSGLPAGLATVEVGPDTPDTDLDRLDDLTRACGILLPSAAFLRGAFGPAVSLYARTRDGEIVGFAAALVQATCAPSLQGEAWWGFLSTRKDWRGHGIARQLGAKAMLTMAERHGVRRFQTGILTGNAASLSLSRSLGFRDTGLLDLLAIDAETLRNGRQAG
ncbi:GNAT family N-acetyltransferase [Mameliella sp.]|uniref:GNAT family N-acetyltransferase n=1 Tax=Mameliella sp. TaxID=1924940 RepID=UPI003B506D55